jgi:RNA polymerase sigma-70 factor (ECF subfamily)
MIDAQSTHPSLLVRLRDERDADSWSQFVGTYSPLILGYLRRRGLQDADAADLTQEVMARVATAIKGFEYNSDKGSFRGWLFTIVENCRRGFSAQERPGRRGSGDTKMLRVLAEVPAESLQDDWDRQYQQHLLEQAARDVRGEFQTSTWRAFWKTAVEGQPPREVAAEVGLSIASVYMAKHRVTERLRQRVQYLEGGHS